jgi:thiol-disulfide isomerase/thioredoxin
MLEEREMNRKLTHMIVAIVIVIAALPAFAGNSYREYSKSDFQESSEEYKVLFFYASWCSFCKDADRKLSQGEGRIPDNVVVYKTDFDSEKKLKKQYGVFSRHTFVLVDREGNELTQWNGGDIELLIDKVQEYM